MSENKTDPFTFQKDGTFYFIRRVPGDLRRHYSSGRISYSLRTRSKSVAKVYYDRTAGVSDRIPMPVEDILKVQQKCFEIDDELRWLAPLVSDTGMRLSEAAGLLRDDIQTDEHGQPWRQTAPTNGE